MASVGEDGVLAVVGASPGRRLLACGVVYGLGALLIYATLVEPPALGWLIFMMLLGAAVLFVAERLRQVTRRVLIWRADGLYDQDGHQLAALEDIERVERGAFALKPSNGFTLKLARRQPRVWAPGLWWCLGRSLGVGGTVSAGQAKFMAEQIAIAVAQKS